MSYYKDGTSSKKDGLADDYDNSYKCEIKHLVECILHDKQPIISIEDGLKTLKIIEAAKESSKNKKSSIASNKTNDFKKMTFNEFKLFLKEYADKSKYPDIND